MKTPLQLQDFQCWGTLRSMVSVGTSQTRMRVRDRASHALSSQSSKETMRSYTQSYQQQAPIHMIVTCWKNIFYLLLKVASQNNLKKQVRSWGKGCFSATLVLVPLRDERLNQCCCGY